MVDTPVDETTANVTDADSAAVTEGSAVTRQRSDIPFPYIPLSDVVTMLHVVEKRGHRCQVNEVAAVLDQQTSSGAFRSKVSAGRMFGVTETSRGEMSLTDLGLQVCDPETRDAALAEAFLNVPLYKKLYDKYAGSRLPGAHGIEQEMIRMGIPIKQVQKARQVFMRSATEANFFSSGRDRLIRPPTGSLPSVPNGTPVPAESPAPRAEAVPMGSPSLIAGLVAKLPPEGERYTPKQRQRWLDTAKLLLDMMYAGEDEDDQDRDAPPINPNGAPTAQRQPS
jgi:hypothetical protein